jgi:GAF domain-containing protein
VQHGTAWRIDRVGLRTTVGQTSEAGAVMLDQTLLVRSLVELADNLTDDFDIVDVLSLLSDRCVHALGVTAAGVLLAAPSGALRVVASSSDAMRTLELFQLQSDQGPCLDAYRTGQQVVNLDLAAVGSRWPRFAQRAAAEGFRSAHSFPMRLRRRTLGALNLLRSDPGPLDATAIAAAQALADIATIAILQHQIVIDAQTLNSQLSAALNSRIVIEQAKGKISQATGSDMDLAFRRMRNHARNHNQHLAELASGIAGGTIPPGSLDYLKPGD